jgi:hypothetical protein
MAGQSLEQLLAELEAPPASLPWTLEDALVHVRGLQLFTRKFGYHLTLGGGVLNKGYSAKDVDLFFLPLDDNKTLRDPHGMLDFLTKIYPTTPVNISGDGYGRSTLYTHKVKFNDGHGRRVDVFI